MARTAAAKQAGIAFCCNICGTDSAGVPHTAFGREGASCSTCGSSVRLRGVVHHLSQCLFGRSMRLADFPQRRDINGVGLSDWAGYAGPLAEKFNYVNTFYHQEPLVDITAPPPILIGHADFLISTDVFEHVPPPVQRAFDASFAILKPNGWLILTVPFTDVPRTIEHFPALHTFKVIELGGEYVLVNRAADGAVTARSGLVFHGGPGDTLEMRVFSRADTVAALRQAGFVDITVHDGAVPEWGILPPHHHGLPITARRPA